MSNLIAGVRVLTSALYGAALVSAATVLFVLIAGFELSRGLRTLLTVVGCIPAASFALTFLLFEAHLPLASYSAEFRRRTIGVHATLLLLPAGLVFRYDAPDLYSVQVTRTIALAVLIAAALALPSSTDNVVFVALRHIKHIMYDVWRATYDTENSLLRLRDSDVSNPALQKIRRALYTHPTAIERFQSTLSCHDLDAIALAEHCLTLPLRSPVSILDVGCGDGRLTRRFVGALRDRGLQVRQVSGVDPVAVGPAYVERLTAELPDARISFTQSTLEALPVRTPFDLVLASHSLYALCDMLENDPSRIVNTVVAKLAAHRGTKGQLIATLASERGVAYRFKRSALTRLFGTNVRDASAEVLRSATLTLNVVEIAVDNVMVLDDILEAYSRGEHEPLSEWLTYFLRAPISRRADTIAALSELLSLHCQKLDEMPEWVIENCLREVRTVRITRESVVLPHKVSIFSLS